ncbi:MAG: hypothetical protein C5B56_03075 [Proteobacteria bacterium]|nr:MAG: hypothetical protein C5B56_03075 [Pseudomonadota bacterium]
MLGGRIVYVTCSLLSEENGNQVRAVLARHQGFAGAPHRHRRLLRGDAAARRLSAGSAGGCARLPGTRRSGPPEGGPGPHILHPERGQPLVLASDDQLVTREELARGPHLLEAVAARLDLVGRAQHQMGTLVIEGEAGHDRRPLRQHRHVEDDPGLAGGIPRRVAPIAQGTVVAAAHQDEIATRARLRVAVARQPIDRIDIGVDRLMRGLRLGCRRRCRDGNGRQHRPEQP